MGRALTDFLENRSVLPLLPFVPANEENIDSRRGSRRDFVHGLRQIAFGLLLKSFYPAKFLIVVVGRQSIGRNSVKQASGVVNLSFSRELVNQRT